jgi:acyl carrier protein
MELNEFVENFAAQLENEEAVSITGDTKFRELAEWDSLVALSIIAMADEKYAAKVTGDDIRASVTVADLFEKIKLKIA